MEKVNLTPTWVAATRIYTEVLLHGNPEGRQNAQEGLLECAQVADKHNELVGKLETIQADAVINFAFFVANYPHDFIQKCWGESEKKYLVSHLKEKFNANYMKVDSPSGAFMNWFYDLDEENRRLLIKWINENYKAFSHLDV